MAERRFYTFIETCQRLAKTEDELKQLIRQGKLNALKSGRGGPMNFRVEEVDAIVASGKKTDDFDFMDELAEVEGSPSDALTIESGADVGLSESIGLGLNPEDEDLGLSESFLPPGTAPVAAQDVADVVPSEPAAGDTGDELPLSSESFGFSTDEVEAIQEAPTQAETPIAEAATQVETPSEAEPARISPSLGGADAISIDEVDAASRAAEADDTVITQVGINVFDERDVEVDSDPLADTVITPSVEDEASIEGAGSGSGLLDLSHEKDESSFGEVLDGIEELPAIAAGGSTVGGDIAAESDIGEVGDIADAEEVEEVAAPARAGVFAAPAREVEVADPTGPAFTLLSAIAFLVMGALMVVVASAIRGVRLPVLDSLSGSMLWIVAGGLLAVSFIAFLITWALGRSRAAQQRAFQRVQG